VGGAHPRLSSCGGVAVSGHRDRSHWILAGILAVLLVAWFAVFWIGGPAAAFADEGPGLFAYEDLSEDPADEGDDLVEGAEEQPDGEGTTTPDAAIADEGEDGPDDATGDDVVLLDEGGAGDPDPVDEPGSTVTLSAESIDELADILGRSTAVPALGFGVVGLLLAALLVQGVFSR
jgi:hypothetical protein